MKIEAEEIRYKKKKAQKNPFPNLRLFFMKEVFEYMGIAANQVIFGDCLEIMQDIETESIDMILCDLPYG